MAEAAASATQLLVTTLSLTIDGTAHAVPASQVRRIDLDLRSYGFEAEVEFWISGARAEDALFEPFSGPKLIEASLSIEEFQPPASVTVTPVVVQGIVTTRQVQENVVDAVSGLAVQDRRYVIRFADPARVLWSQHFPVDLLVQKSWKDLIDAHKGAKITVTYDWAGVVDATKKHVFVALGAAPNEASFYDFLAWLVDSNAGVLTYDAAASSYKLSTAKDAAGTAVALPWEDVASVVVDFPELSRAGANVLNSDVPSAAKTAVDPGNPNAVTGINRDFLIRTSVASDASARGTLESSRLVTREHEPVVRFRRQPRVSVLPGKLVDFSHSTFGTNLFVSGKTYRVREVLFRGESAPASSPVESGDAGTSWTFEYVARLELEADRYVPLPAYVAPRWPALVEGTIVSETGADDELTYQAYTDSTTSLDSYKVKVPLFSDVIVEAPYEPALLPGHFYFPAYKGERVLLALGFETALVDRFLDWRAGARLPADGQGNHLLVGKKGTSQTSVSHAYVDQKPVLLVRRTNDSDNQTIEIKDGTITIKTKEGS